LADFDDVRRIALSLPATNQHGSGFGVNDKGFAWTYMEKVDGQRGRVERSDVLAVRVANADEKEALLAADPEKFFTTAHYNGYPAVLGRLPAIETDELTELGRGVANPRIKEVGGAVRRQGQCLKVKKVWRRSISSPGVGFQGIVKSARY